MEGDEVTVAQGEEQVKGLMQDLFYDEVNLPSNNKDNGETSYVCVCVRVTNKAPATLVGSDLLYVVKLQNHTSLNG